MHKAVGASLTSELVKYLEKAFSPPRHLPEGVTALTSSWEQLCHDRILSSLLKYSTASSCVLSPDSALKEKPKSASEHFVAEKMKKAYYLTQKIPDQVRYNLL